MAAQETRRLEQEFQQMMEAFKESLNDYRNFEIKNSDTETQGSFEVITKEIQDIKNLIQALSNKCTEMGLINRFDRQREM